MTSTDHLALSDFIKSVHQNLRETSKKIGTEEAWQKHCNDEDNLRKYADAMQTLACQFWEPNIDSKTGSRIQWTVSTCLNYFTNDVRKFRSKESDICSRINCTFNTTDLCDFEHTNKLRLLDVGSCYNPFNKFDLFEVTAVDIAPANNEVIKCDFLNVKVGDEIVLSEKELFQLPRGHFNVVVFSLLLEYLPTPKQRFVCCEKAYKLLQTEGLLVIITPDSNHVGVNAKYMKSWRYVLAKMGFSRIKYEKLSHIHCMAFRKTITETVANRWATLHYNEEFYEDMYIPQDLNKSSYKHLDKNKEDTCDSSRNIIEFSELPQCDVFQ